MTKLIQYNGNISIDILRIHSKMQLRKFQRLRKGKNDAEVTKLRKKRRRPFSVQRSKKFV
jgi:hypothetical protein